MSEDTTERDERLAEVLREMNDGDGYAYFNFIGGLRECLAEHFPLCFDLGKPLYDYSGKALEEILGPPLVKDTVRSLAGGGVRFLHNKGSPYAILHGYLYAKDEKTLIIAKLAVC